MLNSDQIPGNTKCDKCGEFFHLNKKNSSNHQFCQMWYETVHGKKYGTVLCFSCLRELGNDVCIICGKGLATPLVHLSKELSVFCDECQLKLNQENQSQNKVSGGMNPLAGNSFNFTGSNDFCPKCGKLLLRTGRRTECSCGYWKEIHLM